MAAFRAHNPETWFESNVRNQAETTPTLDKVINIKYYILRRITVVDKPLQLAASQPVE